MKIKFYLVLLFILFIIIYLVIVDILFFFPSFSNMFIKIILPNYFT